MQRLPQLASAHKVTERLAWGRWMTPKHARATARHRWYLFPHSFSPEFVVALIDEWCLTSADLLLDPFVGSGTTPLAARARRVTTVGYDLMPLAAFVSNVKSYSYQLDHTQGIWGELKANLEVDRRSPSTRSYPALVSRALSDGRADALDSISRAIDETTCSSAYRDFFQLALLAIIPHMSHAVANGGWLRWQNMGDKASCAKGRFIKRVELMMSDLEEPQEGADGERVAMIADARAMPAANDTYTAVITSPPYPNRHDYTRIFGVELMFAFHDWDTNRALRYQTFHSHPEARPRRPSAVEYVPPGRLESAIAGLSDRRVSDMLRGYFLDLYLCLKEVFRVCTSGAKIAFVLGNVQYDGNGVPVDEFAAELGEFVGLSCTEIRAVRWRGNSAQQMGKHGRTATRESVVLFDKR